MNWHRAPPFDIMLRPERWLEPRGSSWARRPLRAVARRVLKANGETDLGRRRCRHGAWAFGTNRSDRRSCCDGPDIDSERHPRWRSHGQRQEDGPEPGQVVVLLLGT